MCKPNDQLQIQRTAEPLQIQTQEPEQLQQQFAPQMIQMEPQMAQTETAERQQEMEQNAALRAQMQSQLPAAPAQDVAPGAPIQEQAPAKRSWKQRQKDKKHAAIARKSCPEGTAVTYDMVTPLQALRQRQDQTMNDHADGRGDVDARVLRTFSTGYILDKKGKPATKADAAAKEADDRFFADYCSKDVKRRKPHLERMVNELVSVQFTPDMLSEDNMRANIVELKLLADKMVYMENVMKDPVNKPFFDQLDPIKKDTLEAGFQKIFPPFVGALSARCDKNGVDFNGMTYYDNAIPIEASRMRDGAMQQYYRDSIRAYQQEVAACTAKWVRRAAVDYAERMQGGKAALERIKNDPSLGLGAEDMNSQYVTRSITILKTGEENDEENIQILKTSVQVGAVLKAKGKPDEELYNRARELAVSRVSKVLDCDVDGLAGIPDEELLVRAPELNALSMDSMFVDDLMKLNHPVQEWNTREPMTLKDDLVGQRAREYSYKVSMLRGLAERARGLALSRQGQYGPLPPEACLSDAERQKFGGKSIAEFAAQREELGARQMESAREKYRAVTNPSTPEFKEWLKSLVLKGAHQKSVHSMKFNAVVNELQDRQIPGHEELMKRIKDEHYFSLAHSAEELKANNQPEDIGEPIFRSFESFISLRATQKLLTPEAFRTMVLQLGAGGGMTHAAPEEEREAAVQENKKGLATYKEVLRAQYDMIERKYGDKLERLDFEEVCDHYTDMAQDFCDIQVHLNMATKYPDLFDPDDPADTLLRERIQYYGLLGNTALSTLFILYGNGTAEDQQNAVQKNLQDSVCREGRSFLQAEHADFHREFIDWKQDVHIPEGMGDGAAG